MEEKEELPFPIEDLEVKEEPMTISFTEPITEPIIEPLIQEEILETYFQESIILEEPLNLPVASLEGSSRVIGNEVPYPFEECHLECPIDIPPVFVHKQASYGLMDGKYLIRY